MFFINVLLIAAQCLKLNRYVLCLHFISLFNSQCGSKNICAILEKGVDKN